MQNCKWCIWCKKENDAKKYKGCEKENEAKMQIIQKMNEAKMKMMQKCKWCKKANDAKRQMMQKCKWCKDASQWGKPIKSTRPERAKTRQNTTQTARKKRRFSKWENYKNSKHIQSTTEHNKKEPRLSSDQDRSKVAALRHAYTSDHGVIRQARSPTEWRRFQTHYVRKMTPNVNSSQTANKIKEPIRHYANLAK